MPPVRVFNVVAGLAWRKNALCGNQIEIFMGLRGETGFRPRMWELPGGKLEPWETRPQALAREWSEELNVEIGVFDCLNVAVLDLDVQLVLELYVIEIRTPQTMQRRVHLETGWFAPVYAMQHLPCAPGYYLQYRSMMEFLRLCE